MQGGGFHPEIWWISPMRNLADFTQIWPVKSTQKYKSKCFSKNSSVWWMQGVGDFTLEIWWISPWNLVDFTHEIWWIITQISPVKSTQNYKSKCVLAKTLQFDECRVGAMTKDFMKSTRFHPEIWWISPVKSSESSPRFHLWNPPKIIKASVSAKTLQFDECKVGAMTKDFMKSAWNPPDFKIMSFCVMIKYRSFVFSKDQTYHPMSCISWTLNTITAGTFSIGSQQ